MRKLKKKLAALGVGLAVMATSAMSLSASAEGTPGGPGLFDPYLDDGRDWSMYYVPRHGSFSANTSSVRVSGLQWELSQFQDIYANYPTVISPSIEFEFRPVNGNSAIDPHTIWESASGTCTSNFPGVYFEFTDKDYDDVTIGFANILNGTPNTSYYATQNMIAKAGGLTNVNYDFEVELGQYFVYESKPMRFTKYPRTVSFGSTYYW